MDALDLDALARAGCRLLHSKEDRSRATVHLVLTSDGKSVAMLRRDRVDRGTNYVW